MSFPSSAVKPAIKPKPKPRASASALPSADDAVRVNEKDAVTVISPGKSAVNVTAHENNKVTTKKVDTLSSFANDAPGTRVTSNSRKEASVNMDANGFILRPDVREDEDQGVKLQEMIELLVAAGYFRARIRGLSDFDKIIGGICWAIEMCDVDVDIEHLLFHENLTIGQKIALTEKIVLVLHQMKCPFRLEPHQMSLQDGMDFIHIFPVIQWLVKKSIEFRASKGESIKQHAIRRFNQSHPDLQEKEGDGASVQTFKRADLFAEPKRMYRHANKSSPTSNAIDPLGERTRIRTTLLEYGHGLANLAHDTSDSSSSGTTITAAHSHVKHDDLLMPGKDLESLLDEDGETLESVNEKISSEILEQLLSQDDTSVTRIGSSVRKLEERVMKEIQTVSSALHQLKEEEASLEEQKVRLKTEIVRVKQSQDEVSAAVAATAANESPADSITRRNLILLIDSHRKEKMSFKKTCRDEKSLLDQRIDELKSVKESIDPDQEEREVAELLQVHERLVQKLNKMTAVYGQVCREVARSQRRLDDVPSRPEVTQYQRRFVELYDQIASKHVEAKKGYILYNQLDDTRIQLEKEYNLLTSVLDSFSLASGSVSGKEQFLSQFEQIVSSLQQTRSRLESRITADQEKRDSVSRSYQELIERQQLYHRVIEKFRKECTKHEILLSQIPADKQPESAAL